MARRAPHHNDRAGTKGTGRTRSRWLRHRSSGHAPHHAREGTLGFTAGSRSTLRREVEDVQDVQLVHEGVARCPPVFLSPLSPLDVCHETWQTTRQQTVTRKFHHVHGQPRTDGQTEKSHGITQGKRQTHGVKRCVLQDFRTTPKMRSRGLRTILPLSATVRGIAFNGEP